MEASLEALPVELIEIISAEFWAVVRRTFKVTIAALDEVNLPIREHLDLFGGATGYSLEYDAFVAFTQKLSLGSVFNRLKRLTMSLSSPLVLDCPDYGNESESELGFEQYFAALDIDQHAEQDTGRHLNPDILAWDNREGWKTQKAHSESVLGAVLQLPGIMPELESLSLHWNNTGKDASISLVQHPADASTTNSSAPLCLRECNLGGLYVPASGLLQFITSVRPERLNMKGIHLVSGTYTSHLEYLTNPNTPTTYYRLDDMYARGGRLIHFNIPGGQKFSYMNSAGMRLGPTTISQETNDAKHKNITYLIGPADPGTVSYAYWLRDMMSEFGPPLCGCRAFILPHEFRNDVEIGLLKGGDQTSNGGFKAV
ncbi:hypothetical protein EKO27_g7715 [Xylaria grammica]|uniref:Uncharacterized protein n=1 Tax=Xylaria grammica TaxID=363999 RepID=A0A439CZ08_9PEZI|nr:hypothetical protein EKO27_g7715 [Xylaria grammica]